MRRVYTPYSSVEGEHKVWQTSNALSESTHGENDEIMEPYILNQHRVSHLETLIQYLTGDFSWLVSSICMNLSKTSANKWHKCKEEHLL